MIVVCVVVIIVNVVRVRGGSSILLLRIVLSPIISTVLPPAI